MYKKADERFYSQVDKNNWCRSKAEGGCMFRNIRPDVAMKMLGQCNEMRYLHSNEGTKERKMNDKSIVKEHLGIAKRSVRTKSEKVSNQKKDFGRKRNQKKRTNVTKIKSQYREPDASWFNRLSNKKIVCFSFCFLSLFT